MGGALWVGDVGELGFEFLLVLLSIRNKERSSLSVINLGLLDVECLDLLLWSSLGGLRMLVNLNAEVSLILLMTSGSSRKSPVFVR